MQQIDMGLERFIWYSIGYLLVFFIKNIFSDYDWNWFTFFIVLVIAEILNKTGLTDKIINWIKE